MSLRKKLDESIWKSIPECLAGCRAWIIKSWDIFGKNVFTVGMLWTCVVAVAACVCSDKITALWNCWFGGWLDGFYDLVIARPVLLWLLVFSVAWLGWRAWVRIWQSRSISPLFIPLGITALWLIVEWPGEYIQIIKVLSFKQLLVGWIIATYVVSIVRWGYLLKQRFREPVKEADRSRSLIVGHPEYFDDGRKKFASTLASLIENTNLRERGITIGITGEWGAGKTLVLKEIKSVLAEKMEVVEFFPWQSSSPENLIEDFFKTLASRLHSHSRKLGRNLENYADKLIELDIDKRLNFLAKIGRWMSGAYLSINDARAKVEKDLEALSKGVVVIIDDLDRLDKDELFETLRLIRNTAHFRNIAYVIAYDPAYTAKMLERKGIENAEEYLHKIFMLTFALPSYEHFTYVELIRRIIGQHFGQGSADFSRLERMITFQNGSYKEFILNGFIYNYRQAVQFGHFLSANYLIMKNMNPGFARDFDLDDWYYLQMLRFFFPMAHDTLRQMPEAFFDAKYIKLSGLYKFSLDTYKGSGLDLPKQALAIIAILFSKLPSQSNPIGIAQISNFYNYFAFRVLTTELSESEFMDMLNGVRPRATMMTEWLNRKPRVWKSVDTRFATHAIGKLTNEQIRIFVGAMLWWQVLVESHSCIKSIREITHHAASMEQLDIAAEAYRETVQAIIGNPAIRAEIIAKLISEQSPEPADPTLPEDEQDGPVKLIESDQAEELLEKLIERELEYGRIKSLDEISDTDSTLFRLMNASYCSTQISAHDHVAYRNYALRPARKIFEKLLRTNRDLRGRNLARLKDTFGYATTGDQEMDGDDAERSDRLIRSIFESHANMKEIIFEWFYGSESDKNGTVEAMHLRL